MTPERIDNPVHRMLLVGSITSTPFLMKVDKIYNPEYLADVPMGKTVMRWCLEYYRAHQTAPKQHITEIFELREREIEDEDEFNLIKMMLQSLSDSYDGLEFAEDLAIVEVEAFFRTQKLVILADTIKSQLARRSLDDVEELVKSFTPGKLRSAIGVTPLSPERMGALTQERARKEILFEFPGAVGELIRPIRRGDFVTFVAPEKRGKTQYLLECALRAYKNGKSVIFAGAGDMDEEDMQERIFHHITGIDPDDPQEDILIPCLDCVHNQTGKCERSERPEQDPVLFIKERKAKKGKDPEDSDEEDSKNTTRLNFEDDPRHIPCVYCLRETKFRRDFKGTPWQRRLVLPAFNRASVEEIATKYIKRHGDPSRFRLVNFPAGELSLDDLADIVQDHNSYLEFGTGLVVADYPDIMRSTNTRDEFRHQENEKWIKGRALTGKFNCALVWATQGKLATYQEDVTQGDLSEDKRKLSHVTRALALNQKPREIDMGIMRMAMIAARKQKYNPTRNVKILHSFAAGKPIIASYW